MAIASTTELRDYVAEELGHTNPDATFQTKIVDYLNRAHLAVCAGGGELNIGRSGKPLRKPVLFSWAKSKFPLVQNFNADITTGTVNVTNDSASITFSSGPVPDCTDWHIKFGSDTELYRLATHSAGNTAGTLDANYVNATNTAISYKLFKLAYTFGSSNILLPASQIVLYDSSQTPHLVELVSKNELLQSFPASNIEKRLPQMAGVLKFSGGNLDIQFDSYPDDIERMELEYIPIPTALAAGGQAPLMDEQHRLVIAHLAIYYLARFNDDDRANSHLATARDMFTAMVNENDQVMYRNSQSFGKIRPWPRGFPGLRSHRNIKKIEGPF